MTDPSIEETLGPLRLAVMEQGDIVRQLKESGAPDSDVKKGVSELRARKKILEDKELELAPIGFELLDRNRLEDLLKRRFFYDQSFEIYGGIAGQFDFGPMGCDMEDNLLDAWRKFFILKEKMHKIKCAVVTPEPVLRASGHVDRFTDLMVKDVKTGECFRLDHLIKDELEKVKADKSATAQVKAECENILTRLDGMTKEEMTAVLRQFNMMSRNGNDVTDPVEFNLMFHTSIGPTGQIRGYLRPETAQGIFVNFSRLLEFNNGRLPFAAAQIGPAFRNEISPRSGLLRVREFTMAEIEHFCDPNDKSHPKFNSVKDLEILLYSACAQMEGKPSKLMKLGDAVTQKLIDNETLGYFIGRIYQFLIMVGVNGKKLRFRQHMSNEMAHYARDCWDAECLTSFGWVECVGCADRSAFDLTQHSKATGAKLKAERKLSEARIEEVVDVLPRKALIAKQFKAEVKIVLEEIEKVDSNIIESSIKQEGKFDLQVNDKSYSITSEMVEVRRQMKKVHVENFVPSVIEPSFGIGRILYVILEHNFGVREGDEKRTFLKLPPIVAPYKCCVLPLSNKPDFMPFVKQISQDLEDQEIPSEVNTSSGSVGRRYARTDELGVPFAVTVDFDTLKEPHSVTLRDRDSMLQVRLPVNEVAAVIKSLSCGKLSWSEVRAKYPAFIQQE
ncbi:hypothetical protein QYM36_011458 [Artemia franciscana]|uniref:Glycine--tRNA ligase n=2 Tax=Artemia franciscana TaxID=6661 RepID=A0AA88KYY7_ARTSF|nr:hypothetical protein QYM36_011458 [Artemia franciscana]